MRFMFSTPPRRLRGLVTFAVVSVLVGTVIITQNGGVLAQSPTPQAASQVPLNIPAGGVDINDQVTLFPPPAGSEATLTSDDAIGVARGYADAEVFPANALLAGATVPGSIPLVSTSIPFRTMQDRLAWVVTFTSAQSQPIGMGKPGGSSGLSVSHFSVVLDASTGEFLMGFFTA